MTELKKDISKCTFLFDWQKERLMGMLDEVDSADERSNGHVHTDDVFLVLDNVLWRTMGVSLDSLPAGDRMRIEWAVREVTY